MIKELLKKELLKGSNAMDIEPCCDNAAKQKQKMAPRSS
jgi:hypothetical protein